MFQSKRARVLVSSKSEGYTSGEVARMAAVSLRQLQWWDERNVISPIQDKHKRLYRFSEVIEISLIAELRRKGLSLQKIRRVMRCLQKDLGKRFIDALSADSEIQLLTDGKSVYLEHAPDRIIDLLKNARKPMFLACITDRVQPLKDDHSKRRLVR